MKHLVVALAVLISVSAALADDIKPVYTKIDLKKCKQLRPADKEIFAGTWRCKGFGGFDVFLTSADERDIVSFGSFDDKNCAAHRTFDGFNSAGGTVEWRVKNGKPIAAILRWTVNADVESDKKVTWLVVHKLEAKNSCPMHYVAGGVPNANDAARKVADEKAEGFACATSKPTYESNIGEPAINLMSCADEAKE